MKGTRCSPHQERDTMWQTWTALAVGGALSVGCSGNYQVGSMNTPEESQAGSSAVGPEMTPAMMSAAMAGAAGAQADDIEVDCVPAGMPGPLEGDFATPEVVWQRLAPVVWGTTQAAPPEALPDVTTPQWADELVTKALDQSLAEHGLAPGAESFLREWLRYPADSELDAMWAAALSTEGSALHALLGTARDDSERVGIFADQRWLAAYPAISTRGSLMLQALFGLYLAPDGDLNSDLPTSLELTRREQMAAHLSNPSCAGCHVMIDPLGVSLEHFDGLGEYREVDAGKPVDATGSYLLRGSGRSIEFDGIADLGAQLEATCEANVGLAGEFLRVTLARADPAYEAGQPVSSAYEAERALMQQRFIRGGRSFRALVKALAQSAVVLRP